MSAGNSGQVATALKSVLEKIAAAAQRSGRNTQVCLRSRYIPVPSGQCTPKSQVCVIGDLCQINSFRGIPKHMSDLLYELLICIF